MKVFNPNNTTHTLSIYPRMYLPTVTMDLRDEFKDITTTFNLNTATVNGFLTAEFDYQFTEGSGYEIEVTTDGIILYRCKAFATSQTDLQNYEL